jgi:hypothetical protein
MPHTTVVEDEKNVGRDEVRLTNELACTVSLSSIQPQESSSNYRRNFFPKTDGHFRDLCTCPKRFRALVKKIGTSTAVESMKAPENIEITYH